MNLAPCVLMLAAGLFLGSPAPHRDGRDVRFGNARTVRLSAGTILDENSAPLVSSDGAFGFVSSASNGSLIVFSLSTGGIVSSTSFGEVASLLSMAEVGSTRIIALPTTTYAGRRGSAVVHLLNASTPTKITRISDVALPSGAQITPSAAALLTSDGRFGVIATGPQPKLFSFSVESGKIISEITLPGWPSSVAVSPQLPDSKAISEYCVAVISSSANAMSIYRLDQTGSLTAKSSFAPDDAHFEVTNRPAFSADGRRLYFATARGERVFSISIEDGSVIDSIRLASTPHRVTAAMSPTGSDLIGVTRVNAFGAAVSILESQKGRLTVKSDITMPEGADLSPTSGVVFDDKKSLALIGTLGGALMGFDIDTGAPASVQLVGGELRNFALSGSNLIGVRSSTTADEIAVVPLNKKTGEPDTTDPPSSLPEITSVNGDGEYLRLVIDGSNFSKDAAVELVRAGRILSRRSPILVTRSQVVVLIPTREIESIGRFDIRVTDSGAGVSNAVASEARSLLSPARAEFNAAAPSPQPARSELVAPGSAQPDRNSLVPTSSDGEGSALQRAIRRPQNLDSDNPKPIETAFARQEQHHQEETVRPRRVEKQPLSMGRRTMKEEMLQISGRSDLVTPRIIDGSLCFVIHSSAPKYKQFTLENPSRIVVDVEAGNGSARHETLDLGSGPVQRVRVGQPRRGILRVVLDLREPVSYVVTRDSNSLTVTIGAAQNASLKRH